MYVYEESAGKLLEGIEDTAVCFDEAEGPRNISRWKVANAVIGFNRVDTPMVTQGGRVYH